MSMVWLNGRVMPEAEATISAGSFGFLYGEGVFETMRASDGRIAYLDRHFARLRRGADFLGLPMEENALRRGLAEALEASGHGDLRVRLTLARGAAGDSFEPAPGAVDALIVAREIGTPSKAWSAVRAGFKRDEENPLRGMKCAAYVENLIARREARKRGADEALFMNRNGEWAEGATTNLFVLKNGEWRTPPLSSGALPGVMRSVLLDRGIEMGRIVRESPLTPDDLTEADAAALTNAVSGVVRLVALDSEAIGTSDAEEEIERLRSAIWREVDYQEP